MCFYYFICVYPYPNRWQPQAAAWEEFYDSDAERSYFYNEETDQTVWDKPQVGHGSMRGVTIRGMEVRVGVNRETGVDR